MCVCVVVRVYLFLLLDFIYTFYLCFLIEHFLSILFMVLALSPLDYTCLKSIDGSKIRMEKKPIQPNIGLTI